MRFAGEVNKRKTLRPRVLQSARNQNRRSRRGTPSCEAEKGECLATVPVTVAEGNVGAGGTEGREEEEEK